jgi:hypothetical protein
MANHSDCAALPPTNATSRLDDQSSRWALLRGHGEPPQVHAPTPVFVPFPIRFAPRCRLHTEGPRNLFHRIARRYKPAPSSLRRAAFTWTDSTAGHRRQNCCAGVPLLNHRRSSNAHRCGPPDPCRHYGARIHSSRARSAWGQPEDVVSRSRERVRLPEVEFPVLGTKRRPPTQLTAGQQALAAGAHPGVMARGPDASVARKGRGLARPNLLARLQRGRRS